MGGNRNEFSGIVRERAYVLQCRPINSGNGNGNDDVGMGGIGYIEKHFHEIASFRLCHL